MDYSQLYSKYYSRMSTEGVLKSFIFALIVGFAVNGIVALVTWLVGFDMGIWIALGGLVIVTAALVPVFYFRVFRPTEAKVAKRLDSLGMDERIITMQELQGDTSEIASLQRADASSKVEQAENTEKQNGKLIRFKMPMGAVIAAACIGVFGIAFTVVTGLSGYGVIDSGKDVLNNAFTTPITYTVTYSIDGINEKSEEKTESELTKEQLASYIAHALAAANSKDDENEVPAYVTRGSAKQSVKAGESSEEFLYTAKNYYYFVKWVDSFENEYSYEDGYTPSRHEHNVNSEIEMKACFEKVKECENDANESREIDFSRESSGGGGGHGGNNKPGEEDLDLNKFDFIIDGETKYMTDYDLYYEKAMSYLSGSDNLSSEDRAMIETYFEILK